MSLPEIVQTAFERAGVTPPGVERVDRIGYNAAQRRIIEKELNRRRQDDDAGGVM